MSLDFTTKDVKHKIVTKFINAYLPEARKAYNLKAVHQPELDIHGIASKAEIYNLPTSPKVIEEGLTAAMNLIVYLVADGYRIKTPLFNLKLRVPGEYDGSETHLPDGVFPQASVQVSANFREYLKTNTETEISGIEQADGYIAEILDEATGLVDDTVTRNKLLTIRGCGLKIEGDDEHKGEVGFFFEPEVTSYPAVRADIIAVNEPRTLKVIVPPGIRSGKGYTLKIVTQSSAKNGASLLKNAREVLSEFTLTAQS